LSKRIYLRFFVEGPSHIPLHVPQCPFPQNAKPIMRKNAVHGVIQTTKLLKSCIAYKIPNTKNNTPVIPPHFEHIPMLSPPLFLRISS